MKEDQAYEIRRVLIHKEPLTEPKGDLFDALLSLVLVLSLLVIFVPLG